MREHLRRMFFCQYDTRQSLSAHLCAGRLLGGVLGEEANLVHNECQLRLEGLLVLVDLLELLLKLGTGGLVGLAAVTLGRDLGLHIGQSLLLGSDVLLHNVLLRQNLLEPCLGIGDLLRCLRCSCIVTHRRLQVCACLLGLNACLACLLNLPLHHLRLGVKCAVAPPREPTVHHALLLAHEEDLKTLQRLRIPLGDECHESCLLVTLCLGEESESLESTEETCDNATSNHLEVLRNLLGALVVAHLRLLEVNVLAVQRLECGVLGTLEFGLEEDLEALEALVLAEGRHAGFLVELLPASEAHVLELAVEASKVKLEALGSLGGGEVGHGGEPLLALE